MDEYERTDGAQCLAHYAPHVHVHAVVVAIDIK